MTKKRTSRKQDFCFRDMPLTKIKASKRSKLGKSKSQIGDIELLFQALWQSLVENDIDSFKEILQVHLEAVNKEDLVRRTKISRRTLYRMLSSEGNPTLENVGKILQALAA